MLKKMHIRNFLFAYLMDCIVVAQHFIDDILIFDPNSKITSNLNASKVNL